MGAALGAGCLAPGFPVPARCTPYSAPPRALAVGSELASERWGWGLSLREVLVECFPEPSPVVGTCQAPRRVADLL